MKNLFSTLQALLLCVLLGAMLGMVFETAPEPMIAGCIGLSLIMGFVGRNQPRTDNPTNGMFCAGLLREIWLGDLLNRFWDDDSFLQDGKNLDPFVENDAINLAEIGAKPNVVKNRTSYPVPATVRVDTPINLPLDDYSSDSTIVRDVETVALNYAKRQSVIGDHKGAILEKIADDGIYNISPNVDSTDTPVFETSGAHNAAKSQLVLHSRDIAKMAERFDILKYPKVGRKIAVPADIFWDFVQSDATLLAQAQNNGKGGDGTETWVSYFGFIIYSRANTAYYNPALNKIAYGAVPAADDRQAAIAYIKGRSFGRGKGSAQMYAKVKDPDQQGDVINFRQRAVVLPFGQKILGAIKPKVQP